MENDLKGQIGKLVKWKSNIRRPVDKSIMSFIFIVQVNAICNVRENIINLFVAFSNITLADCNPIKQLKWYHLIMKWNSERVNGQYNVNADCLSEIRRGKQNSKFI